MPPKQTKIEQLTESVGLRLTNRVAGVLVIPILLWALADLAKMHDDNISMMERVGEHEKRITTLETWRDNVSYLIHGTINGR